MNRGMAVIFSSFLIVFISLGSPRKTDLAADQRSRVLKSATSESVNYVSGSWVSRPKPCDLTKVKRDLNHLVKLTERRRKQMLQSLVNQASSCINGQDIKASVNSKLVDFCTGEDSVSMPSDFKAFEDITNIIDRFDYDPAIATLVGCVNQSSTISGLSASHFPARAALLKMGESAVPHIEAGLKGPHHDLKCPLSELLVEIGGMRAKSILEKALQHESDSNAKACIRSAIDLISR